MTCYKTGSCGVYEMRSCADCPASKPEYLNRNKDEKIYKEFKKLGYTDEEAKKLTELSLIFK